MSAFWIAIYFTVVMSPLFAMLIGATPPGRGFWREFSVGLGFVGLSMVGWQFFLTGRFKKITSPYGIDVVYHFHRLVSLLAFSFILIHPVIIIVLTPSPAAFLNLLEAPWYRTAGVVSFLAFAVVISTSLCRVRFGIGYESWRAIHGYVSVIAVALSMAHIVGVGYYVQEPLKRWLWISMVAAWILALLYIRILKPFVMFRRPYIIENVIKERGNSWTLVLKAEGHKGISYRPGQFAWLTVGKSLSGEHPFSFSSSAMNPNLIEMTIKALGDFTSKVGEITPGTRAYIEGPYGTFTIDQHRSHGYVFIAGGVGITPVISILKTMRDRIDMRPLILFYGSKNWKDITFYEEIEDMRKSLNLKIVHILENAPAGWDGETGYITAELMARHLPENRIDYQYFVCGPLPMQIAVKTALDKLGLPMEKVQSESFNFV